MNEKGEVVQAWLRRIGKDREWLADQLAVAGRHTVDKWLGPKGKIPSAKWTLIERLMSEPPELSQLKLSLAEFSRLQRIQDEEGVPMEELIVRYIRDGLERWEEEKGPNEQ